MFTATFMIRLSTVFRLATIMVVRVMEPMDEVGFEVETYSASNDDFDF